MSGKSVVDLISYGVNQLRQAGALSPRLDAELILAHVLEKDRYFIYMNPGYRPGDDAERRFCDLLNQRVKGKPVQYIVGRQEFMGLDFLVNPSVLIPRPDTELLVESVLDWLKEYEKETTVVLADIGTGSGAIAVSMAYYSSNTRIIATDVSIEAIEVAEYNARKHGVEERIEFVQGDLFQPLEKLNLQCRLDGIITNPPYITEEEMDNLQREVKVEPRLALYGGKDGLDFYRRIAVQAPAYLVPGGLLAMEIGYNQADSVAGIIKETGKFEPVKVLKDLEDRDRVVFSTAV
jgi:release factor glutamine methyltransferase